MKKTILVVDDDDGILEALHMVLDQEGYAVQLCSNGRRLRSLRKENAPNLILLDVLLSGTDGRELCKELKSHEGTRDIPVIMLSAAPEIEQSVKEAHANDFIAKPFDLEQLITTIEKHII